jgi:hypothetical protein
MCKIGKIVYGNMGTRSSAYVSAHVARAEVDLKQCQLDLPARLLLQLALIAVNVSVGSAHLIRIL